jgi:hypothetical protein
MEYDELCKKVLELDSAIRFTGVLNNKGELVSGGNRGGVDSLLSDEEVKRSVHYTVQRWENAQSLAFKLGEERSAVMEYEKVTLISIPFGRGLFLISAEPNTNFFEIINKTKSLLEKF